MIWLVIAPPPDPSPTKCWRRTSGRIRDRSNSFSQPLFVRVALTGWP